MPGLLQLLLPFLLSIVGGKFAPKAVSSLAANPTLSKIPGVGAALGGAARFPGAVGTVASILPFILPALIGGDGQGESGQIEQDVSSNDANFTAFLRNQSPAVNQNDISFLQLLQQKQVQGNLSPALNDLGLRGGSI